jgi:hypothetical protein
MNGTFIGCDAHSGRVIAARSDQLQVLPRTSGFGYISMQFVRISELRSHSKYGERIPGDADRVSPQRECRY